VTTTQEVEVWTPGHSNFHVMTLESGQINLKMQWFVVLIRLIKGDQAE